MTLLTWALNVEDYIPMQLYFNYLVYSATDAILLSGRSDVIIGKLSASGICPGQR